MRATLPLLAAFALAACGGAPEPEPTPETSPTETPIPVEPDGGIGDGAEPLPEPEPEPDPAGDIIPMRFHGVWDYVEGTCARESDLRMEVSGKEIMFYESVGVVTSVVAEDRDVVVTLAMEGEGEMWEERTRLSLVGSGDNQRLETSDGDAPKAADEYPSKRCPA